jgi:2-polyprenyl-6-methoxyphenol hydroxylase-like FAD-dependent oxidoreductase
MTMGGPRVAIVGAGLGGLALAQGLLAAGVEAVVHERDPSPRFRRQGYRLHISETGERALAELLPAPVHRRVVATASRPGDLFAAFDHQLTPLFEQVTPVTDADAVRAVDRYAFRRALMTGLEERIHFDHEVREHTTRADGRVELRFADGQTEVADVVVGADGVGSRIRGRLLPDFDLRDIGVRCIYGAVPLSAVDRDRVPPSFLRGFCWVAAPRGLGVAFGPVLFREPPAEYGDYLMAVLTGTSEALGLDDGDLFALGPQELWSVVVERTRTWHPQVAELIARGEPGAAFPIALRSCTRVDAWPAGPVTLLGDAVHPMTPAAGAGANTALRDAAHLTRALTTVLDGRPVPDALAAYRDEVVAYGTDVVAESLENAERMFGARVGG